MKSFFSKLAATLFNTFLFIYEKLNTSLLGPALIGVIVFGLFFDFSIVEPDNTAWMLRNDGDALQHYLGSYAFRSDEWHFPITKTVLIDNPEGISIIFTDSNPLLSIIAKCFKFVFPPHYQFFGFWFLLCWILQSVFGYLLINKVTNNKTYALLSAILFCLLPTQLSRLGHANLVGFWTILWTLYVFLNADYTTQKKQLLFFIIFSLSALIHPYLLFMCLSIGGVWYIREIVYLVKAENYKILSRFIGANFLYGIGLILLLWVAGFFYNVGLIEGLNGFGFYSMNLNAPFNAMYPKFSKFMDPLPAYGGQYEGYQYLGLGIFLLFILITIYSVKKDKPHLLPLGLFYISICLLFFLIKQDAISFFEKAAVCLFFVFYGAIAYALYKEGQKNLLYLYIPSTFCFFYSLSNRIMIGETVVCEYTPDSDAFYYFFLQSARSSGRFFWVTLLFLLIAGLFLLYRYFEKKNSFLILSIIIFIQYADVSIVGFIIPSNERSYESPLDEASKKQISAADRIVFLSGFDIKIAEFSLLHGKPVNKFYLAREPNAITIKRLKREKIQLVENKLDARSLYLIDSPSDLPANKRFKVNGFYGGRLSIVPASYATSSVEVKRMQSDSLTTLFNQIKTSALVLIAVQDEASGSLPDFFKQQMDLLYNSKFKNLAFRNSYIAVFSYGKLVEELLDKEHSLEYHGALLDHKIFIKSAGYDVGNESILNVNGVDLSLGKTGLNVLVLDPKGDVWETYNYNTFTTKYPY